jgi:hypothetical protein
MVCGRSCFTREITIEAFFFLLVNAQALRGARQVAALSNVHA